MTTKKGFKKIQLDLTESEIAKIALLAHERDITFNEYVNQILREFIDKLEKMSDKQRKRILDKLGVVYESRNT
jgi:ATP-dependent Clp protease adapter protein ClpS